MSCIETRRGASMRVFGWIALFPIFLFLVGCRSTSVPAERASAAIVVPVDPLEKILRETAFFREIDPAAHVARGEHASFQFAFRAGSDVRDLRVELGPIESVSGSSLRDARVGFVGYVSVGRSTPTPSRDRIIAPSGLYPDPIMEVEAVDVAASATQPIWITVAVPVDATPGTYRGTARIRGVMNERDFVLERDFSVVVYPTQITDTSLWVTNWFSLGGGRLEFVTGGESVEEFSDAYWDILRLHASKMAEYRQNVAIISPLALASYTISGGAYEIDFGRFDQAVEIFIEEGVVGRIEGGHIGGRESTWTTPFVVSVPVLSDGEVVFERLPISDETARTFYTEFFTSLVEHLRDRDWYDIYTQHIADEPIAENIDSYVEIARFVKSLAPDMRIIEACHTRDLDDHVDVWVPQLNFLHEDFDFYQERLAEGDEVWFYTCLAPQGEYANRFIELPLLKTRVLHWINYRFGIPGYLHWGFNAWRGDPYSETTGIIVESGNVLPGGDAWIVYPDNGRLHSSIRLEAMRDGIVDYELLKMLEETHPEEAKEIARQVVYRFDLYDMSIPDFREKRKRILELLNSSGEM